MRATDLLAVLGLVVLIANAALERAGQALPPNIKAEWLIWGGAAFWLYDQGQTGWAIFMAVWGVAVISSVDNFVKPLLISRTASLPILLIALGVFGGVLAFGFIGIFLGPVLLALGLVLAEKWTASHPYSAEHE